MEKQLDELIAKKSPSTNTLLTTVEAANFLKIKKETLYKKRDIPLIKGPKNCLYELNELVKYLDAHRRKTKNEKLDEDMLHLKKSKK